MSPPRASGATALDAPPCAVQRDLLPLPLLPAEGSVAIPTRSRRIRQKASRCRRVVDAANEVIWSINVLHGSSECGIWPSEAQVASLAAIHQAGQADTPPQDLPAPEAALRQLLGSKASYAEDLNATAPFCRGSVSWPDSAVGVALSGAVPGGERSRVADALARLSLAPEELETRRAS